MKNIKRLMVLTFTLTMLLSFNVVHVFAETSASIVVNNTFIEQEDDYTIKCGGGTAVYDPETKTLTLTNATLDQRSTQNLTTIGQGPVIHVAHDLNIVLIGNNTITLNEAPRKSGVAINVRGDLKISGSGSLTIDGVNTDGIVSSGSMLIDGTTVIVNSSNPDSLTGIASNNGTITLKNSNVTLNVGETGVLGAYGISISGSIVTVKVKNKDSNALWSVDSGNIDIVNSTVVAQSESEGAWASICAAQIVNISENSHVTVESNGNTAIYACEALYINGSYLNASATGTVVYAVEDINIFDSFVISVCNNEYASNAIRSAANISVSGKSEVIADGGIEWVTGMTVAPVTGGLVEVKYSTHEVGEAGAVHYTGSPYSIEMSFNVTDNADLYNHTYVHIKEGTKTPDPDTDPTPQPKPPIRDTVTIGIGGLSSPEPESNPNTGAPARCAAAVGVFGTLAAVS